MSWAKLDDRANEHEKQLAAGPKACWLWACGLMYCNRQTKKTGLIPKTVVHSGMLFPGLGRTDAAKLVASGLWLEHETTYEVHEYHGWNPELSEKRADAGRKGGRRSGEARREANDEANWKQVASDGEANTASNGEAQSWPRAQTRAHTRTDARGIHPTPLHSGEEDPPTPLPAAQRPDPLAASLTGKRPRDRADVNELFEDWKLEFGFVEAKLCVGIWNADAETLAEAIDAYSLDVCRLVVKHARADGMVSGRDDETKQKHESIGYIFGNQNAFNRILRAAREAEKNTSSGSVSGLIARKKAAGGEQ